jgi:tRNA pseudouridine55 synthase
MAPDGWHGILNVDKPPGPTSYDVVRAVRRAANERRVGHAGTLDPLASGVLVVCLGAATRVIEEIQAGRKEYEARVRFGETTTTYDAEGSVVGRTNAGHLTREGVEEALLRFRGEIAQTPPMHSALKHGGRPLYELARAGVEVERAPRSVTVYALELASWQPPEAVLAMTVSRGTYVRSLAHDLGEAVGVGAHLVGLVRTAVGPFRLEDADPPERIVAAFEEGWADQLIYALDEPLKEYPAAILSATEEEAVRSGRRIALGDETEGGRLRAYAPSGTLVAVLAWHEESASWQPERVFPRDARRERAR